MKFLSVWSWLFAAKTFVALLLTLYVAFGLDLEKPYWAALTVYIVAQPLSGALRSKAVYRFVGTLLGAGICVVLVPNLVNSPELLSLALAAWIGVCLYISLLDRSPRSYVFMLAGYSISFIALPSVADPTNIFAAVLARTEEISLAIVCTTVVDSIFFPISIGPMLTRWVCRSEDDVRKWAVAAFGGEPSSLAPFAADLNQIERLANSLVYDSSPLSGASRQLDDFYARMLLLLPALSSVDDRVRELRRLSGGMPATVQGLLDDVTVWCKAEEAKWGELERLRRAIASLMPMLTARSDWQTILVGTLLLRLREVLELMGDCRGLCAYLAKGATGSVPRLVHPVPRVARVRHVDHGMAAWSGLAAALIVYLCCVAWIELAWPEGAAAVQMAAVACCFFATLDDPAPMIRNFAIQQPPGMLMGLVYLYVLPLVSGFEMLALALAPTYLLAGSLMAVPSLYGWGMALAECTTMSIAYQATYGGNLAATVNNDIATLLGISGAAVVTGLIRSAGAAWSRRRLVSANQREIVALTRQRSVGTGTAAAQRNRLTAIMMDRLGQLIPRLAAGHAAERAAQAALSRLRVGINIVEVQRWRRGLPGPAADVVAGLLVKLGTYVDTLAVRNGNPSPPVSLCAGLDEVIAAVSGGPETSHESVLILALVGIRRGLFPTAPPYVAGMSREDALANK
ncbi:FUSC family protein [Telmatospirillum sp.]|uniref:FUSC family protein n=1 Tax=Telmatospirillum sp. TaxID=2079197 RepID=UPI0028499FD6|nr:FUSC family protein [Telmatospirillum sp.]MDR3436531.1 FUSC family protein [Telmatospirillum sp.]